MPVNLLLKKKHLIDQIIAAGAMSENGLVPRWWQDDCNDVIEKSKLIQYPGIHQNEQRETTIRLTIFGVLHINFTVINKIYDVLIKKKANNKRLQV